MKDEKTMFLIEQIPGFDMRLKLQGDGIELIKMLQGAMTVEPSLKHLLQAAIDLLPAFQACVDAQIMKDFNGNRHQ